VLLVSQAGQSVWNSLADYLRDPAHGLNSFRRQASQCDEQRIERIRDIMTRCTIFTYLITAKDLAKEIPN